MKTKKRHTFISTLFLVFVSVFLPCVFFCLTVSFIWMQKAKEEAFQNDYTLLSLVSKNCDMVLNDTTQAIGLLESNTEFSSAVMDMDSEYTISQFFMMENTWQDNARLIYMKPYISDVYFYLERFPNYVFTKYGINTLNTLDDLQWLSEYNSQDKNINLWAQPVNKSTQEISLSTAIDDTTDTIYIYRRLPCLYWEEAMKGVMVVKLEKAYLDSLFNTLPEQSSRNVYILDDNFTQLYSLHGGNYTDYLQDEDIIQGGNVHFIRQTSEGKMLVSIVNSDTFNWSYISVFPLSAVSERYSQLYNLLPLFMVLALGISILLALFITRKNYQPIKTMIKIIDNYKNNGVIENIEDPARDEYGYIISILLQTMLAKQEAEQNLERQQILQKESNLLALQSQINPHFLYNTLDVINWEAIDELGEDNNISTMLLSLSSNLRYITQKDGNLVTLQQELDNLNQFITLQKLFTEDRILFTIQTDKEILNKKVPKLILQPIVENSIRHGFSDGRHGYINVSVQKSENAMLVSVIDDGMGFTPERLAQVCQELNQDEIYNKTSNSLGLKNINSRLKLLYGKEYKLNIQSEPGKLTNISFEIPFDTISINTD